MFSKKHMNKAFKKKIRNLHLWLGLGSGLVVFIVALTGSLLVFEKEIDQFNSDTSDDFITDEMEAEQQVKNNAAWVEYGNAIEKRNKMKIFFFSDFENFHFLNFFRKAQNRID